MALGLEVFRETKRLEDKAQNLEGDAVTVEKWKQSLSKRMNEMKGIVIIWNTYSWLSHAD